MMAPEVMRVRFGTSEGVFFLDLRNNLSDEDSRLFDLKEGPMLIRVEFPGEIAVSDHKHR